MNFDLVGYGDLTYDPSDLCNYAMFSGGKGWTYTVGEAMSCEHSA